MLVIANFLFLFFFSFANPISLGAWIAVLIAFYISWEYLGLWITSIVGIWSIVLFPFNRPYIDADFDYFGEWIIYSTNLALFVGMAGVIVFRLLKKHHEHRENSAINKLGKFLSFASYGILSAYFGYLFLTDLWHDYQPAWQAYSVILIGNVSAIVFLLFQTYKNRSIRETWICDLFTSVYSFVAFTIVILAGNLIFPILAIKETKKVVEHHGDRNLKHCIQASSKSLETWLYLTPLTAWNKPNEIFGAGLRHAVLVIDKNNEYILYHWSYKLRKWEFTSVGFEPGAFTVPDSLECTPKENYWSNLPFLFPEGKL